MNRTTALKIFFVASALVTAPGLASARGPRLKQYKKLLLCAGAVQDSDSKAQMKKLEDATALELEKQLREAGVEVIGIKEAEAVAAKAMTRDGGGEDEGSDDSAGGGQPNAQALAMMNNPNMPAEAKAAMAQYMNPASKKGIAAQYAGKVKGMKGAKETEVEANGSAVAGHLLHVCPHGSEKVTRDEYSYPEFFKVMDELEPDGWVSVRARFGETRSQKGGYMEGISMTSSQFLPVWVYEVSVHNAKGKRVWEPGGRENEILSDKVKLPKDEAGQMRAIRESIPASVGQLVEKLTE